MLYLDGISLKKLGEELKNKLVGKSINKVVQTSPLVLNLNFGKEKLILSSLPSLPLCYISDIKEDNILEETTSFSLNLKKNLLGSSLIDIEQSGFDRILIFSFSKLNELGEVKKFKLIFEIMGRHSNIILTDFNLKILTSLKATSLESKNDRVIFVGANYTFPIDNKISPLELTKEEFDKFYSENTLIKNVQGIGKSLLNSINSWEDFKSITISKASPKIFFNQYNEIILATFLDINIKEYAEVKYFDTIQEMINYYISLEKLSTTFKILKDKLLNTISKEKKKVEKTILSITKDIESKKDFDRYRELGDILASSLYSIKKGMDKVELYDFYNDKNCIIELDPLLTPNLNLEKIYKKYNKMKTGLEFGKKRLEEMEISLKYLIGLISFVENSEDKNNLKLIEEELISQNIIKSKVQNKKKAKKQNKVITFGEGKIGDISFKYGRNNIENDTLTNRYAHREDIWFHCKDIPGAHLIVDHSYNLSEDDILNLAKFCASLSKQPIGTKLTVDYTKVKYLNKPKNSKPGFVTYRVFDTITVTI